MQTFKVGTLQHSGLEIYVFDPFFDDCPAFDGDYLPFPGAFDSEAGTLTVNEDCEEQAASRLVDAANSADCDNDRQLCEALGNLALRIGEAVDGRRVRPDALPDGTRLAYPKRRRTRTMKTKAHYEESAAWLTRLPESSFGIAINRLAEIDARIRWAEGTIAALEEEAKRELAELKRRAESNWTTEEIKEAKRG